MCVLCILFSFTFYTKERERERDSEADDNAIENKIHIRRFVELRIQQLVSEHPGWDVEDGVDIVIVEYADRGRTIRWIEGYHAVED